MRIDQDHADKLDRAISGDPATMAMDIEFMRTAIARLNMWERGLFAHALERAVKSKRKTAEQRVILALFAHGGTDDQR